MPFLAPTFARLPPLNFLLADQMESRQKIARHLGVSLRTLQRYQARGNAPPRGLFNSLVREPLGQGRPGHADVQ